MSYARDACETKEAARFTAPSRARLHSAACTGTARTNAHDRTPSQAKLALFTAIGLFDSDVEEASESDSEGEDEDETIDALDVSVLTENNTSINIDTNTDMDATSGTVALNRLSLTPSAADRRQQRIRNHALVQKLYDEGVSAFNDDDSERALQCFTAALNYAIHSGPTHYFLLLVKRSLCLSSLAQYHRALIDSEQAVLLHGDSGVAHYCRGVALQGIGLINQAYQAFQQAYDCDTDDGDEDEREMIEAAYANIDTIVNDMTDTLAHLNTVSPQSAAESSMIDRLMQWLADGQCYCPYVRLHSTSRSRGLYSLTALPTETLLLSVHHSRMLTLSQAYDSPIGSLLLSLDYPLSFTHSYLALLLHYHYHYLGDLSPYKPYLDVLPSTDNFQSLPLYYGDREQALLTGTDLFEMIEAMKKEMRGEYDLMVETLTPSVSLTLTSPMALINSVANFFHSRSRSSMGYDISSSNINVSVSNDSDTSRRRSPSPFSPRKPRAETQSFDVSRFLSTLTYERYLYYRCVVLSRVFALPMVQRASEEKQASNSSKVGHELCLVPLADMLNAALPHSANTIPHTTSDTPTALSHWAWEPALQSLTVRSLSLVPKGAEIRHSYGTKCNRRWLLHYGLVPARNSHHHIVVKLSLTQSLTLLRPKLVLLRPYSTAINELSSLSLTQPSSLSFSLPLLLSYTAPLTQLSFAMLRIFHCTHSELKGIRKEINKDVFLPCISVDNELSVLSFLAFSAHHTLSQMSAVAHSDEQCSRLIAKLEKKLVTLSDARAGSGSGSASQTVRNKIHCLRFLLSEKQVLLFYAQLKDKVQSKMKEARVRAGHTRAPSINLSSFVDSNGEGSGQESDAAFAEYWQRAFAPLLRRELGLTALP